MLLMPVPLDVLHLRMGKLYCIKTSRPRDLSYLTLQSSYRFTFLYTEYASD